MTQWVDAREASSGQYPHEVEITEKGMLPSPLNGDFTELNEWMADNIQKGWRWYWTYSTEQAAGTDALLVAFEDASEALMFKLTWGGK